MKIINKMIILGIVIILNLSMIIITAHTESDPFVTDLIAGKHYDAGDVEVWNDEDNLYVTFNTSDGWEMGVSHLHVATSLDGIPQKKGNPPPGQFDYGTDHDPKVTEFTYQIELDWDTGTELYIAAHAEVCKIMGYDGGLEETEATLPAIAQMMAVHATVGDPSYFTTTIAGGTSIDGIYEGWCVDLSESMEDYLWYVVNVYSSYESPLPPGLVDNPENLDLINYILNQHFVGQPSICSGDYTYGDVQRAIWELIDDSQSSTGLLGPWEQCRVDEILADVGANGEGYIPGCGDVFAVILDCIDPDDGQTSIIPIPIECTEDWNCETAWGDGFDFPGKNWATYFTYTVQ